LHLTFLHLTFLHLTFLHLTFLQWNEADAREIKRILENVMRQQTLPGTVKLAVHGVKNLPASKSQTPGTFHATICFGGAEILRLPEIAGHAPNMWKATTVSK
jgi:hypothetical protein